MSDTATDRMDPEMIATIERVLAEVRDDVSGRPVNELEIVQRVHYSREAETLIVFTTIDSPRTSCIACDFMTAKLYRQLRAKLLEAFQLAFPELTVEVR